MNTKFSSRLNLSEENQDDFLHNGKDWFKIVSSEFILPFDRSLSSNDVNRLISEI